MLQGREMGEDALGGFRGALGLSKDVTRLRRECVDTQCCSGGMKGCSGLAQRCSRAERVRGNVRMLRDAFLGCRDAWAHLGMLWRGSWLLGG